VLRGTTLVAVRVIISGDRNWRCGALARRIVARLVDWYGADLIVVHGNAAGVDTAFAAACALRGVAREPHAARWHEQGNRAGPIRNAAMVAAGANFCIAVHRSLAWSRGTRDLVERALAAGIPVYLIDGEDAEPKRIRKIPERREG
jgi:hypothetical protein